MATAIASPSPAKSEKRKNAWKNLPDVWALMKPRGGLLALGFVLMAINRISGLVLPASTKYLIDNVIARSNPVADADRACSAHRDSDSGTHFVHANSSALQVAQKMIAELRRQVQAHIGRLPVSFYDANKTGAWFRGS